MLLIIHMGMGEKGVCIGCLQPEYVWQVLNFSSHLVNNLLCVFVGVISVNNIRLSPALRYELLHLDRKTHTVAQSSHFTRICCFVIEKPDICTHVQDVDYMNYMWHKIPSSGMQHTESEFLINSK